MVVTAKHASLGKINDSGIMAVIRAESIEKAIRVAEAVKEGGIEVIEVTFTVPGAIEVLKTIRAHYPAGELLLGVGTVLEPASARLAILAGAEFVVSPVLNRECIELCNGYGIPHIPGCMTPTEIYSALTWGADIIKLFPGEVYGPGGIKAIKGPLPQVELIPTGGVNLDNVEDWFRGGCFAVGVGSELTRGAQTENYAVITDTAREFVKRIKAARHSMRG